MKKVFTLLLGFCLVFPASAYSTVDKGINLDLFLARRQECLDELFSSPPARVLQEERYVKGTGEQSFVIKEADIAIMVDTFCDSSVVEFAGVTITDRSLKFLSNHMVAIMSSVFDYESSYIRRVKLSLAFDNLSSGKKGLLSSMYAIFPADSYVGYTFMFDTKTGIICFVHEDSGLGALDIETRAYVLYVSVAPSDKAVVLSIGEWECPEHIPAGEYTVTPIKSAIISIYRNGVPNMAEYLSTDDGDEIGRLVLQSGDTINIQSGKLEFTPFK